MAMLLGAAPAMAQSVQSVNPDAAIDGDLSAPDSQPAPSQSPESYPYSYPEEVPAAPEYQTQEAPAQAPIANPSAAASNANSNASTGDTYKEDDLIGAAEGLFGKGAEGLARVIEDLLSKQGEPNGYIVGREGGGAFIVGLRYGSGTLFHKVEGERPVYWTGPSIGFDAGANAGNTFILVYNLYDTEDLYTRFPAGEGQAYLIGGFNVSYLRKGDKVLIPIRMGAGLRLGVNAGYMKFSKKQKWLPF
ncbi:DUF1134 domain-containing protein [Altererythrobacter endophyticus]|uniref:DUF1134 domain-containing protein n=2 Tax=Altericroceibacterium endophyticum TaxID=1808508 RepID=A0A6I4T7H0_9SPHN|nr:DUF1134 domain-containing protein [Altericroceibacterium endophyticum]